MCVSFLGKQKSLSDSREALGARRGGARLGQKQDRELKLKHHDKHVPGIVSTHQAVVKYRVQARGNPLGDYARGRRPTTFRNIWRSSRRAALAVGGFSDYPAPHANPRADDP